jgi:hypothetical protein
MTFSSIGRNFSLSIATTAQPPDTSTAGIVSLVPARGTIVVVDGTRCYHRVTPLLRPALRLSVPLVFPNAQGLSRPTGLDPYLYGENA